MLLAASVPVHCPCLFSCLSLKWVNISITEGAQLWWPDTRHWQLWWATPGATFMGLTSFLNSPIYFAQNTTSNFSVPRGQLKFSLLVLTYMQCELHDLGLTIFLLFQSRRGQSKMALAFRASEEHDKKSDVEWILFRYLAFHFQTVLYIYMYILCKQT